MKNTLVILLWMFTFSFYAQSQEEKINLSSPYHTVFTHLHFLQQSNYQPKKSARVIYGEKEVKAQEIVIKIKKILDAKGLKVNMASLPINSNYLDTISNVEFKNRYVLFPNQLPNVYLEKINDNWYYSRQTNQEVFKIYKSIFPFGTDFIKKMIPNVGHKKVFNVELWQYLGFGLFIIIGLILFGILKTIIFWLLKMIERFILRFEHKTLNKVLHNLARPLSFLVVFQLIENYLPTLQLSFGLNSFLIKGIEIAKIVFWIYMFLQLVNVIVDGFEAYSIKTKNKLDDQLVPILRKALKVVIVIFGVLKMLTVFGVNTSTVLAGVSIGGLAIAFASQDTVKNLIGTFMIFIDKPFHIGDWIVGGGIEGTVEEVGFRSTRVRAADTTIFTIPNSKLSEIVINNMGLRKYRRYSTKLGIRYDTPPELIETFVKGVRQIIEKHPETLTASYNVEFIGFGDSALEILLNTYFLSLEWGQEQSSKHRLHMSILKLASTLGVEFAFPSQTLMIEEFPDKRSFQ